MSLSPLHHQHARFVEQINAWLSDGGLPGQLVKTWLTEELHCAVEEIECITVDYEQGFDEVMHCNVTFSDESKAEREWTYFEAGKGDEFTRRYLS